MTMVRADVITLITESPAQHGVFEDVDQTGREVMCTVRSASYKDIAAAGSDGLRPELVFRLAHDFEYNGEKTAIYSGRRYNIDRVYFADGADWIDLTCSRGDPGV